jgi:hypothetical protein
VVETPGLTQRNLKMYQFIRTIKVPLKTTLTDKSAYDQNDIDRKWTFIKESIHAAVEETIGIAQPKRRNQWFDEECNNSIKWKNDIRKKMLQRKTTALVDEYKKAQREAKTICYERKKFF